MSNLNSGVREKKKGKKIPLDELWKMIGIFFFKKIKRQKLCWENKK